MSIILLSKQVIFALVKFAAVFKLEIHSNLDRKFPAAVTDMQAIFSRTVTDSDITRLVDFGNLAEG